MKLRDDGKSSLVMSCSYRDWNYASVYANHIYSKILYRNASFTRPSLDLYARHPSSSTDFNSLLKNITRRPKWSPSPSDNDYMLP